jgi:hypothetical protein
VQGGDEIAAVVEHQLRPVAAGRTVERRGDVRVVPVAVDPAPGEHRDSVAHEGSGGVVLRRQGVRRGQGDRGAAGRQDPEQVRGLRRDVQARRDRESLQGTGGGEPLPDLGEHGHRPRRPVDAFGPRARELGVRNVIVHAHPSLRPPRWSL